MNKQVAIVTFGCQMNEYDSEVVATPLEKQGCMLTDLGEKAGIVILNTCSAHELCGKPGIE